MDYQINQLYFLTLINKYRTSSILKPSTMRLKFYFEIRSNIQLMEDLQFLRSFKSLSVPISRHKDGHWCLLSRDEYNPLGNKDWFHFHVAIWVQTTACKQQNTGRDAMNKKEFKVNNWMWFFHGLWKLFITK